MGKLIFLDTETTGLADDCDVWEIGFIERLANDGSEDLEYRWMIRPSMRAAEPNGLRIGRYYERIGALRGAMIGAAVLMEHPDEVAGQDVDGRDVAAQVAWILDGATIVGAVPDFDDRHLSRWLRANDQAPTWHHHLVDVTTLAAGALGMRPPWDLDKILAAYGLSYDEADRHTALGDARMVRDLYDAVYAAPPVST